LKSICIASVANPVNHARRNATSFTLYPAIKAIHPTTSKTIVSTRAISGRGIPENAMYPTVPEKSATFPTHAMRNSPPINSLQTTEAKTS
jgi:hypothetical protein